MPESRADRLGGGRRFIVYANAQVGPCGVLATNRSGCSRSAGFSAPVRNSPQSHMTVVITLCAAPQILSPQLSNLFQARCFQ